MKLRLSDRGSKFTLFLLFVLTLLFKAVSFHYFAFHSIPISSLWNKPTYFFLFYAQKISFLILLGSFIFLSRKSWWTIGFLVFCDLWCISNLIYYKIFDDFLTIDSIFMAGNMAGGWSAVLPYINYQIFIFIATTALFTVLLLIVHKHTNRFTSQYILFAIVFVCGIAFNNCINAAEYKVYQLESDPYLAIEFERLQGTRKKENCKRFLSASFPELIIFHGISDIPEDSWHESHVLHRSIISYFLADLSYYTSSAIDSRTSGKSITLSSNDVNEILSLSGISYAGINPIDKVFTPNQIVIVLVESLESWVFEKEIEGQTIMPNLRKLIDGEHTLYYHKVKSQALAGNSGDGQMIINTGLLPISSGVACMDYSDIVYPNLAYSFPFSTIINPWRGIWNQEVMTRKYSFNDIVQPKDGNHWNDEEVFSHSRSVLDSTGTPHISLILTVSSHSPFNTVDGGLSFSRNVPRIVSGYLNCLHYTDKQIGAFVDYLHNDEKNKNTTIVITGDHTIFKSSMLAEFSSFSNAQCLSIASNNSYCPLIIYSPLLIQKNNKDMETECYQMDIFPTVQKLIGDEVNPWRGLGVNLLDPSSIGNRVISEDKAYEISDKIIRSDFFRNYSDDIK